MPSLSQLARTLRALSLLNLTAAATFVNARFTIQRPIYAIAHMVLRPEAVTAALSHGANAIEVDLIAWKEWWADHDGGDDSAGSTARELFIFIAEQRKSGKDITYIWLDIKNPDECPKGKACSIQALRDSVNATRPYA
ncbi:hypothetical protein BDV29DRAFT_156403 [Aspergillus leporis]|uniref:Phospholipase D n=1 Tax=Aspergillus leporis TaxID=41062 RepID=A0A5N5X3N5_9EURO|nr:hypothetical protein BDV29DRAFT_156403 [Aspergillus leporis]